jgi:AMMECR1 domain-containing protein
MVMDLAAAAADDARYGPIEAEELHQARIEVALIGPLNLVLSPADIRIGESGLAVQAHPHAVLPPEAAVQNGWSAEDFLDAICVRADLPADAWQHGVAVSRFATYPIREQD